MKPVREHPRAFSRAPLLALFILTVAGLALVAPGTGQAAKPHPLFGRAVVGNSAEIFLMGPTVGASADFVARALDYDSVTAAALTPWPLVNIAGGERDSAVCYSILDVAYGDFDGDDRDEPVVVRGVAEAEPWTRSACLAWSETGSTLDWSASSELFTDPVSIPPNSLHSPADLRLVAGDFDADGRDELAQVWRDVDGRIQVKIWELNDQNEMVEVASAPSELQPDALGESAHFDAATGDVNGDGRDELIVGGTRGIDGSVTAVQLFVTLFELSGGTLEARVTSTSDSVSIVQNSNGSGMHVDHVAIATGTLRPQLRDQVVFSWAIRNAYWYRNDCLWCCAPFTDYAYDFDRKLEATLAVLDVSTAGTPWTVSGWTTGRVAAHTILDKVVNDACSRPNLGLTDRGTSLGVTTGDLTGDGIDEVVWAATDSLNVLQMGPGDSLFKAAHLSRVWKRTDPSRRIVTVADLDARPDSPGQWVPEVVLLGWNATSDSARVTVYRPTVSDGTLTGLTMLTSYAEPQLQKRDAEIALVACDMDGDAVRLGTPKHIPLVTTTQPRVLLKTPPVHFDVFGGTIYDLAGCYDGSGTYLCDCFQASYSNVSSTTFAVQTQTGSDWGVSAGLKTSHEFLGVSLETSLTASYGQHFSRAGDVTTTYTVEQQVTTAGQDRILADETSYEVWEYPVYAPGAQGPHTLMGHLAVAKPLAVSQPRWFTFGTWPSSYNPLRHEAGNVLSYPRFGSPSQDPNIAEMWKSDRWDMLVYPGGDDGTLRNARVAACAFEFGVTWNDVVSQSLTRSWSAGVEMGASVGAYGVTVEVSGHYSRDEMSTRETTIDEGIGVGVSLGTAGGAAEAPYTIQPYIYRGKDGTLVLDYTVEPVYGNPGDPNWWDSHYTASPDLAFVLPKRYNAEKGIPVEDPRTRNRSPDIWVRPDTAAVGDTVTIYATVHNFSLHDQASPVCVRFSMGDPDSASAVPIEGIGGEHEFWTPGALLMRDTATVMMKWRIPADAPDQPWIFAQVDPDDDVAEIHEDNNKGYTVIRVSGGGPVSVGPDALPAAYRLQPASPNPFRDRTTITFDLPRAGKASLVVYDLAGRRIATLVNGPQKAGTHVVTWNGRREGGAPVPAGMYFCRLRCDDFVATRRLLRLR